MAATKLRVLNPKSTDIKYTGPEPDWTVQPTSEHRQSALMRAFGWYGYYYDKKIAKQLVLDWIWSTMLCSMALLAACQNLSCPIPWDGCAA